MKNTENVSMQLTEIREVESIINKLPLSSEKIVFGKDLILGIGAKFKTDFDNEIMRIRFLVNYVMNETKENIVKLETELTFKIKNLNRVVKVDNETNKINFQDNFLKTLITESIGTTRGILFYKTKGTDLANFPLPLIKAQDLLNQMKKNKD
ncbi:MAG: hypothetical protein R6U11_02455 [Bacteroidales bacterium]